MESQQATNPTTGTATERQTVVYDQPSATALSATASAFLREVESMQIDSQTMYGIGAETLQSIKGKTKALDEQRLSITRPIDAAKLAVMNLFRDPLATLATAETAIKNKLLAYDREQAAAIAKAKREAEETAQKERERVSREAAKASAEADFLRETAAAAPKGDAELMRAAADAADRNADNAKAAAQLIVAAPVAVIAAKAAGVSTARPWKARLLNKVELIKWVAQAPEERQHFLDANESALTAQAKATKENTKIGGVEAYQDVVMSARATRSA